MAEGPELPEWDSDKLDNLKSEESKHVFSWQLAQLRLLQRLCAAVERLADAQEEIAGG